MPHIKINGSYHLLSWSNITLLATVCGKTTDNFLYDHGALSQGRLGLNYLGPLPPTIQHLLQTQTINPQAPETPTPITPPETWTTFGEAHVNAILNDVNTVNMAEQLFTIDPVKVSPQNSSGKMLQDLYKYKTMVLRKGDSVAYEKMHKIVDPYPWTTQQGLVGIEIEVENMVNTVYLDAYWESKADGSLRNNGVEFVSVPLQVKQIQLALEHLYQQMNKNNTPDFSNRTSTHIHVNCRDLTQDQLFNFILLYALFEKHFYQVAGTRRLNSIFCVPLFRTNQLNKINDVVYALSPDWHKYCGLNLLPLYQNSVTQGYGTIEFRHLYGVNNPIEVMHWINDILCLRKAAMTHTKEELLENIKQMNTTSSYMEMYQTVFEKGRKILSNKKDFEECVSNIKRELFGNDYTKQLSLSEKSVYWQTALALNVRG